MGHYELVIRAATFQAAFLSPFFFETNLNRSTSSVKLIPSALSGDTVIVNSMRFAVSLEQRESNL